MNIKVRGTICQESLGHRYIPPVKAHKDEEHDEAFSPAFCCAYSIVASVVLNEFLNP